MKDASSKLQPTSGQRWVRALLLGLLTLSGGPARPHNGEDHGAASAAATAPGAAYFTATASSDNFELVLRYAPLRAGEPATLRLFVADFATNLPIHGAKLTLTTTEAPVVRLTATETSPGDYRLTGQFPADHPYALAVQVAAPDGRADLLLLRPVDVGKLLPAPPAAPGVAATSWLSWQTALVALGSLLLGAALTFLLRRRRPRPVSVPVPVIPTVQ